jgi:D-mannonate dehydratase
MTMTTKFKLHIETRAAQFDREFETLKSMNQYIRRNRSETLKATKYILHNNRWERFATFGNQIIPKSELQKILRTLDNDE